MAKPANVPTIGPSSIQGKDFRRRGFRDFSCNTASADSAIFTSCGG
jgi:hypothetical protein